ncbi:uncharacterized protein FYW61_006897 [Anableps anableps]
MSSCLPAAPSTPRRPGTPSMSNRSLEDVTDHSAGKLDPPRTVTHRIKYELRASLSPLRAAAARLSGSCTKLEVDRGAGTTDTNSSQSQDPDSRILGCDWSVTSEGGSKWSRSAGVCSGTLVRLVPVPLKVGHPQILQMFVLSQKPALRLSMVEARLQERRCCQISSTFSKTDFRAKLRSVQLPDVNVGRDEERPTCVFTPDGNAGGGSQSSRR